MKTFRTQDAQTVSIADGVDQLLCSLSISGFTNKVISIELFLRLMSSNKASVLYAREAQDKNSTLTIFAPIDTYSATYNYSEDTVNAINNPTYTYDQSSSRIDIFVDNPTGSSQDVEYQVSYTINYI